MSFGLCFAGVDVQQRFANVFVELLLKVVFVIKQGQVNVMNNGVGVHKDAILLFKCFAAYELGKRSIFLRDMFHVTPYEKGLNIQINYTSGFCTYINGPDTL